MADETTKTLVEVDVQAAVEYDLARRLYENDWSFTKDDAQMWAAGAGAAGGSAACTALGLPVAAPACGEIGGRLTEWLSGVVWDAWSSLFGGPTTEEQNAKKNAEAAEAYASDQAATALDQSISLALGATATQLAELARIAGLDLVESDVLILLGQLGLELRQLGGAWDPPDIKRIYLTEGMAAAVERAKAWLNDLRVAGLAASARILGAGAARVASEAGILAAPDFMVTPIHRADAVGAGAGAGAVMLGAGALLGLVLLARRRAA